MTRLPDTQDRNSNSLACQLWACTRSIGHPASSNPWFMDVLQPGLQTMSHLYNRTVWYRCVLALPAQITCTRRFLVISTTNDAFQVHVPPSIRYLLRSFLGLPLCFGAHFRPFCIQLALHSPTMLRPYRYGNGISLFIQWRSLSLLHCINYCYKKRLTSLSSVMVVTLRITAPSVGYLERHIKSYGTAKVSHEATSFIPTDLKGMVHPPDDLRITTYCDNSSLLTNEQETTLGI
jgi:hypothetical protein